MSDGVTCVPAPFVAHRSKCFRGISRERRSYLGLRQRYGHRFLSCGLHRREGQRAGITQSSIQNFDVHTAAEWGP